jgi:hypothetical protein
VSSAARVGSGRAGCSGPTRGARTTCWSAGDGRFGGRSAGSEVEPELVAEPGQDRNSDGRQIRPYFCADRKAVLLEEAILALRREQERCATDLIDPMHMTATREMLALA